MEKFKTEKLSNGNFCNVYANGDKFYFNSKSELHRDNDLPAVEYANGDAAWYINGRRHRNGDKPAVIEMDGFKAWYTNGKLHRENNPAVIRPYGDPAFYIDDKRVTEAEAQVHRMALSRYSV